MHFASAGGNDDPTDTEEDSEPCFDYQPHCDYWSQTGYCDDEEYSGWMRNNCPKSCASC